MVAGCGNKCIKYVFWLLNFILFALGIIIVGLAIWIRWDDSFLSKVISNMKIDMGRLPLESFYFLLYVIIGIGAFLLILGFLGCCGSACEIVCTIGMMESNFITLWRNELVARYNSVNVIRETLDNIQSSLHCCGAVGCTDYSNIGFIPGSCQCSNAGQIGCATYIWSFVQTNMIYVFIVLGIILLVERMVVNKMYVFKLQLLTMIFSCILMSAVKEKRNA
uniref:Tetraspanin n=1 Tax=Heterorhabditis bacteriophora TaxID=37862 RepID=A0A1I7WWY7_HETBA